MRRHLSAALFMLGVVTARGAGQETEPVEIELPAPGGPWAVGTWHTAWTDTSRDEVVTADPSDRRQLVVRFWYPADSASRGGLRTYMDTATAGMWVDRFGVPAGFERHVRVHSREGVRVAAGRFPVVVFSHGLSWPSLMYQSYLEELASRGYVVAAIDHPYGADVVVFPDGRVERYGLWPDGFARDEARDSALAAYVGTWRDDIRYVVDDVLPEVNATGRLQGHLDLERIGVLGHSYGGSAAALALDDPRIDAGFAMESRVRDSSMRPLAAARPFMHVIGGYNRREMAGSQYRAGAGPYYEVIVNGMWHAMFSDLIYIYAFYGDSAWQRRHQWEISPTRGLAVTRRLMVAFFGRYLKEERDPALHPWWPDEPSASATSPFPEVEMRIDVP